MKNMTAESAAKVFSKYVFLCLVLIVAGKVNK